MADTTQGGWPSSDELMAGDAIALAHIQHPHGPSALADEGRLPDDGGDALESAAVVALAELAAEVGELAADSGDDGSGDVEDDDAVEDEDDEQDELPPPEV